MSMITQCPSCGAAFRVTPQQLQAQHGTVRCGRCTTVFDGFKALATLRENSPAETPPAAASAASAVEPSPPPMPQAAPMSAAGSRSGAREIGPVMPARPRHVISSKRQPDFAVDQFDAAPPQRRSGGWTFGMLLLLLALSAQGAYFYRGELAASVPELRPHLNRMCEYLRCAVALPQQPRQIIIEASDMQATDPGNPGLIALTATLHNQAAIALGYPALDVILTNSKEHTVARRIFLPAEYLDAGKDPRIGIAPNAEVTVRLNLDSGDLGAAGFRLDLLAAPAR